MGAPLQRRAALLALRPERRLVDVHDDLVPVAARARVEPAGERGLGDRPERIRPPLESSPSVESALGSGLRVAEEVLARV